MSKPNPAPEPTMEEILASIRRIISDGDEMAASAPPPPPPPPAAQRSAPPSATQRSAAPMPVRPAVVPEPVAGSAADTAADDADIFDLTDAMVAKPETVAPDFDFDSMDAGPEEDVAPVVEERQARPEPATRLVEPEVVQFRTDEEPMRTVPGGRSIQAERPIEASTPPRPAAAPTPAAAPREMDNRDTFSPAQSQAADRPAEPVAESSSPLMSPQTDSAVAAAFGRLANTILSRDPKTLEDLVKEMLRPMLKEWLDDNLPVLVERLVREEIERVSRGRR